MRRVALAVALLALAACGVKAPPRPPGRDDEKASTPSPIPNPTATPTSNAPPTSTPSAHPERSGAESKGDAGTP